MDDKVKLNIAWEHDDEADAMPGTPVRPEAAEPFHSIVSRRAMLKGTATAGALLLAPAALLQSEDAEARRWDHPSRLRFRAIEPQFGPDIVVPRGYHYDVVLRWGDPLTPNAPEFDPRNQTGIAQAQQFGFNADLVLWFPLHYRWRYSVDSNGRLPHDTNTDIGVHYPRAKDTRAKRCLMVVNHEYTSADDMFPDYDPATYPTPEQTRVEIEAHGFSIVELVREHNGQWRFDITSPFNRRCTGSTPMDISGPLRGHEMMQSESNPSGTEVRGTLNNCAGGKTPWGTILTCEENFDQYFANFQSVRDNHPDVAALSERIAAPDYDSGRGWEKHVGRFDLSLDPKEYNRFGFIVEIDPYDPSFKPKKRTAMGRFKHEGAAAAVASDGRVAVYSGDDARFEYVYKFISNGSYDRRDRAANLELLDEGTLYVARFDVGDAAGDDRGVGEWLALSPETVGWSMEEILLNTRGAADVVGATPMDRPEDIEVNPKSGNVYIALTNNSNRTEPNEANPRVNNQHGHVIELVESGGDAGSLTFEWNIFILCGDPNQDHDSRFADIADPVAAGVSPISDPDNLVHDDDGNLWISTDGMPGSGGVGFGQNDGIFAVPVEGRDRGLLKQFFSGVPGGEVCGPEFAGDNRTLFCAIQHPNDGQAFQNIWPLDEEVVSKPSLVAVYERRGRKIGY